MKTKPEPEVETETPKIDLGIEGVSAACAAWAYHHELLRELGYDDAPASVHLPTPGTCALSRLVTHGAAVTEAHVPGCRNVTLAIHPSASRQTVLAAFEEWLATSTIRVADAGEAKTQGKKPDYVTHLRDLAVLRCRRAGLTSSETRKLLRDSLASLVDDEHSMPSLLAQIDNNSARLAADAQDRIDAARAGLSADAESVAERANVRRFVAPNMIPLRDALDAAETGADAREQDEQCTRRALHDALDRGDIESAKRALELLGI